MSTAFDRIRDALETATATPGRRSGHGWSFRCPAHHDTNPSLSLTPIEGSALLYCHSGCDTDDILNALHLTRADLYDERNGATYHYDSGRIVHRTPDKKFNQTGDKTKVELYHLARLQNAGPGAVYLVEGEKDVHAIESLGAVATTAPMGATNFAKVDVTPLQGRHVIAIVDRDEAGDRWAAAVETKLSMVAAEIRFAQAAAGKDAADHIAAGLALDALTPYGNIRPNGRSLHITWADQITMRAVRWLWETMEADQQHDADMARWLPLGGLCLLGGREGIGKTTWAYRIAAAITAGKLPGAHHGNPANVVVCATEDDWARTVVPRLAAAGADLTRVARVDIEHDGHITGLTLPADIPALAKFCHAEKVAFIVLDPLMGTISATLDSHKDQEVRIALEPLSRLAHEAQLTILGLIHVNKSQGNDLLTRLMASAAFSAVARAVLFAAISEPKPGEAGGARTFLFGQPKNNLAAEVRHSLSYRIEGIKVGYDDELGIDIWSSRIENITAQDGNIKELVSAQEAQMPQRDTPRDRARKWLQTYLTQKGEVASAAVKKAAIAVGFSEATLKRASQDLRVRTVFIPGTNQTAWTLPTPHYNAELVDLVEPDEPVEPEELVIQTGQSENEGILSVDQPAHQLTSSDPLRVMRERAHKDIEVNSGSWDSTSGLTFSSGRSTLVSCKVCHGPLDDVEGTGRHPTCAEQPDGYPQSPAIDDDAVDEDEEREPWWQR